MPRFAYPGVVAFLPPDQQHTIDAARRSADVSAIDTALGQCAEHTDAAAQADILAAALRTRDRIAATLHAIDMAIEYARHHISPPQSKRSRAGE